MPVCVRWLAALILLGSLFGQTPRDTKGVNLWVLKPVVRPMAPAGVTKSTNPIDAFIAAEYKAKGLKPAGPADKYTLLRRVYLDLIGIPPTPAEQDAFLKDDRRTPTRRWWTGFSPASSTASAMRGTGSTSCATPTPTSA